jgi:hypothetical protein
MKSGYLRQHSEGLRATRLGFEFRQEQVFSLLHNFRTDYGVNQPLFQLMPGGSFLGDKASGA